MQMGDKEIMIFQSGRPRLGVEVHELNADLAPYFNAQPEQGVLVLKVIEDTPAAKAGLKAGDVLLKVDDEATNSPEELVEILGEYEDGDEIRLEYSRAGKNSSLKLELEISEGDAPADLMHFEDEDILIDKPGVQEKKRIIIRQSDPTLKKSFEWHGNPGSIL
jgi:serine protease Do